MPSFYVSRFSTSMANVYTRYTNVHIVADTVWNSNIFPSEHVRCTWHWQRLTHKVNFASHWIHHRYCKLKDWAKREVGHCRLCVECSETDWEWRRGWELGIHCTLQVTKPEYNSEPDRVNWRPKFVNPQILIRFKMWRLKTITHGNLAFKSRLAYRLVLIKPV